ncbi:hypothetical protein SAMN05421788_102148 [Filimonas lacunae]|uniref:Uncharacterized protein n=1 Tax=Filimonas lacunae TaxID=477680 RepID=A0A173MIA9_9BACT|nr:hypothetical protein [Filimonas lacunae]BAV07230.1 hypothetical protein FLA_3253 [Filimonas lacunae]SIS92889.1 hypothetical protein SAMN05421788_102148 [Filimonas lacunae]
MNFWKKLFKKEVTVSAKQKSDPATLKSNTIDSLKQCNAYFERNIQTHILFKPEYEVSKTINTIIENKQTLTQSDVIEILAILNDIDKEDHYDGTGWYDYQLRLSHLLHLNGFKTDFIDRKVRLITP